MTNLLSLSNEILLHIIPYLRPLEIERLACAFNARILLLCLPFLQDRIAATKNKRRMGHIWGPQDDARRLDEADELPSLRADLTPFTYTLDYLMLNGDLHWLAPLDTNTEAKLRPHLRSTVTNRAVDDLIATCSCLGLTIPPGFEKLMRNIELQERIPSTRASYFTLGGLGKVNMKYISQHDQNCVGATGNDYRNCSGDHAQGYIAQFYSEEYGYDYWKLYLDTAGHHAILRSRANFSQGTRHDEDDLGDGEDANNTKPELTEQEGECNVRPSTIAECVLEGTNFEEWLCHLYFGEWIMFNLFRFRWDDGSEESKETKTPEMLAEYLRWCLLRQEGGDSNECSDTRCVCKQDWAQWVEWLPLPIRSNHLCRGHNH